MSSPVVGAGQLTVIDIAMQASYFLFEPIVRDQFPSAVAAGLQTVNIADPSIYVGAYLVAGAHSANAEVIQVTAVTSNSFSAAFTNTHAAGDWLFAATFPVRYPTDPLMTQLEFIAYISSAYSDYLTDCPLVYQIADLVVPPTAQNIPLPPDCMFPIRVAYQNYPLRETSQANLDSMYPVWQQQGLSQPKVYYRDKLPIQNVGIWPRAGNNTPLEVVYAARNYVLGWADGFAIPDPFTNYVLYRTLSFCFSKDGEIRNPGLAKYFQSRYDFGVKVTKMIIDFVQDTAA